MENSTISPGRPGFLTVLCILSFIGSSWGIINGVIGYLSADTAVALTQKYLEDVQQRLDDTNQSSAVAEAMMSQTSKTMTKANVRKNALVSIVTSVLTFLGAFFMFRLRRVGYWTYLLGIVVSVAAPLLIYGPRNFASLGTAILYLIVGVLFAVLYGLNFKSLR